MFAIKGSSRGAHEIWPRVESIKHSRANKPFIISVDACKEILYGRLKIVKPGTAISISQRLRIRSISTS